MEWTPEALKAEIDYRQAALREDAARARRTARPVKRWWQWYGGEEPEPGNHHREAA